MPTSVGTKNVVTSLTAYASGDVVGGLMRISLYGSAQGVMFRRIQIVDTEDKKTPFDVYLLRHPVTEIADNAALAFGTSAGQIKSAEWADAIIGRFSIAAADYIDEGPVCWTSKEAAIEDVLPLGYVWVYLIARGAVTYTTTSAIRLSIIGIC